jgi:hypothetical protein
VEVLVGRKGEKKARKQREKRREKEARNLEKRWTETKAKKTGQWVN